jgi:uncharacterized protein
MRKNLDFLELEAGRIIPGKTLLFFDEIQACPRAIMALRYFYEQMPELHVIAAGSMIEAFAVQSEILDSYRDDFSKYTPKMDITCLDAVFLNVAQSIGRQLKYTRLNAGHSGLPVELEFRQENLLAMYRGILAEQFVAQEMLAGKDGSGLYYWARDARRSRAEVDYLAVHQGSIYPVEVKSGAGGSLKSLHLMLEKYPHCPEGIVLYSGIFKKLPEQKLTFMPLYCAAGVESKILS